MGNSKLYIAELSHFTCPNGHSWAANARFEVFVTEKPDYRTGPLCPYCYVDFMKKACPAKEIVQHK